MKRKQNVKKSKSITQKVLRDHKKSGKKYIPPFMTFSEPLEEIRWENRILPEIIWMGILNDSYGVKRGVELSTSIAKIANEVFLNKPSPIFAFCSSYSMLSTDEKSAVLEKLEIANCLVDIRNSLSAFLKLYPKCPLYFLNIKTDDENNAHSINTLKTTLEKNYTRVCQAAMLIQANIVYIAELCGKLKFINDIAPPDLEILATNFDSEKGRSEASRVRGIVTLFFGKTLGKINNDWSFYFWNRGLEIDICTFD